LLQWLAAGQLAAQSTAVDPHLGLSSAYTALIIAYQFTESMVLKSRQHPINHFFNSSLQC
jgi:hypothetical protein